MGGVKHMTTAVSVSSKSSMVYRSPNSSQTNPIPLTGDRMQFDFPNLLQFEIKVNFVDVTCK